MRSQALQLIKENIKAYGFHVYMVSGGPLPRFSYTIGLTEIVGAEVALAGGAFFEPDQLSEIIDSVGGRVLDSRSLGERYTTIDLGNFALRDIHPSWTRKLLLGVFDYYRASAVKAYQIVPDAAHMSLDVPRMDRRFDPVSEPIWRWIQKRWPFEVSDESTATTNLDALRGDLITEVARWEETHWEMFAGPGPDVPSSRIRVVPLATLLAHDPSLESALHLEIGRGLWRKRQGEDWHAWGDSRASSDSN
jgi:hypothetical protein